MQDTFKINVTYPTLLNRYKCITMEIARDKILS